MNPDVTRRTVLKWMGGIAAGIVLSPAPYALVDDLTIATQTRGRSVPLPTGARGRVRTRCSACPRGCSIELHTVGGRPYLAVPATAGACSCALRPAVHHLASSPGRLDTARLHGRTTDSHEGLEVAASWLEDAVGKGASIGVIDLSGRPAIATPSASLVARVPGAVRIETRAHWLDDLAARVGLDPDLELSIDPRSVDDALWLWPGRSIGPVRAIERGEDPRAVVDRLRAAGVRAVLLGEDGVGARPDDAVLSSLARIDVDLGAIGSGRPIPVRRRVAPPANVPTVALGDVDEGSFDLLVIDASRVAGAVPWRRMASLLRSGRGRSIVFAPTPGPAMRHGDLVLPASAPLEIEEGVGGERFGDAARIALSTPVLERPRSCVDLHDLTRRVDSRTPCGADALAAALVEGGYGRLRDPEDRTLRVAGLGAGTVATELRRGAVWEGEGAAAGPVLRPAPTAAVVDDESPRLVLEGAMVVAAGERVPDVLSKVAREQPLLPRGGRARAHPEDLADWGIVEGARCRLRTSAGRLDVVVFADAAVRRGHVLAGCGFGPESFGDPERAPEPTALEVLDLDPRSEAPPVIHALEVS